MIHHPQSFYMKLSTSYVINRLLSTDKQVNLAGFYATGY